MWIALIIIVGLPVRSMSKKFTLIILVLIVLVGSYVFWLFIGSGLQGSKNINTQQNYFDVQDSSSVSGSVMVSDVTRLNEELNKIDYCTDASDCVAMPGKGCTYACGGKVLVNKNEVDKVSGIMDKYSSDCDYAPDCGIGPRPHEVGCIENHCRFTD